MKYIQTVIHIMLLEFSVTNFGPFRDKATLSMQATAIKEHPENIIQTDIVKGGLLTSALIYGANASGKSYILHALSALKTAVSDVFEKDYEYAWYEPFRLSKNSIGKPTEINIKMIIDETIYDYTLSYVSNRITHESLYHYPPGKNRSRIFERDGDKNTIIGGSKDIFDRTSTSSAYLTLGSKYNDPVCDKVRGFIKNIIIVGPNCTNLVGNTFDRAEKNSEFKKALLNALYVADFGISDFGGNIKEIKPHELMELVPNISPNLIKNPEESVRILKIHTVHNFSKCDADEEYLKFPMEIESAGTRQMFGLMGPLSDALMNGKVVLVDDFGSYLHPVLSRWILEQFKADVNTKNAQLIVNTHATHLMDTRTLQRRDQIFFTEKSREDGSASLYSLSDFRGVRKETDILKAYFAGRFDAIPDISSDWVFNDE